MINFGSGVLSATPLTDANGNAIQNPQATNFADLQDTSLDFSFENKELYGSKQFAIASGRGKASITGKAGVAKFNAQLFNAVFFGQVLTPGYQSQVRDVTGVTVPATPHEITVAPPGGGVFLGELGVRDENGNPMSRVNNAPSTGQYSVDGSGKYTFSANDASKTVYIDYQYKVENAGSSIEINNQFMGTQPTFRIDLFTKFRGESVSFTLYSCTSDKMSFATKQEDFTIPDFGFKAQADGAGRVGVITFSE
ncbi:hypothetical protein ACJJJB_00045 (plasmid) [Microbulbifer sp. ANSA001]|uniref:hypothetical protein n=1 Tax=Microbulbifer sp. ANSA001 TaxID=3243358 RepID=UPI0040439085